MAEFRSVSADMPTSATPPRRAHLLWLAAAYALVVSYGSLVPLEFQSLSGDQVAQRVNDVLHQKLSFRSRSDLLVNVVLAVPLGFLLTAGLCADRRRMATFLVGPAVVVACVAFAGSVEFLQLFCPRRVSSLHDMASQGFGSCIGALAWAFCGQAVIDWCRRVRTANSAPGLAGLLLPSYIMLLIAMHTAPFDLTTRPKEAAAKWRAGRVRLVPFQTFCENPIDGLDKTLINFAYFLPVGVLWGLGPVRQRPRRSQVLRAAGVGLLAAASVEALQLMVFSRSFEATDIFTGLLATVIGAEAAAVFCRTGERSATWHSRVFFAVAILLWVAALMNDYWRPFNFTFESGGFLRRLHQIEWVPLADSHHGNDVQAILHLFDKILLFLVLGALFTLGFARELRRFAGLKVIAATFLAALILEAGQLFLAGRHFGITDVAFAVLGGWLGYFLVATLARLASPSGIA